MKSNDVLEGIAEEYRDSRPIIDPVTHVVLVDCPVCKAQESDPMGIWRPVQIVPRDKLTIVECTACGLRHEQRV